ncbi:hypothetical protein ACFL0I_00470 [Gemmatimonadota bacterium]
MPRTSSSPGKAALLLILVLLLAFIAYDLTSQDPLLLSLWDSLTGGPGRGERVRDGILEELRRRR